MMLNIELNKYRMSIRLFFLLCVLIFVCSLNSSFATDYYHINDGTAGGILDPLNKAHSGDVICLDPGDYRGKNNNN